MSSAVFSILLDFLSVSLNPILLQSILDSLTKMTSHEFGDANCQSFVYYVDTVL